MLNEILAEVLPVLPSPLVRSVARRYVAGATVDDAVRCVQSLRSAGRLATLDVLGEETSSRAQEEATLREYAKLLDELHSRATTATLSVKPTALGLKLNWRRCRRNIEALMAEASAHGTTLTLDMEDSSTTDPILAMYRDISSAGTDQLDIVLQAALRRAVSDAHALATVKPRARVCKGIYREPRRLSYTDPDVVRWNFIRTVEILAAAGSYVEVATHDEWIVWHTLRVMEREGISARDFEFQVLLGVDEELASLLVKDGYQVRVYVPFGERWLEYCVRRARENPQIVRHVTRDVARRLARTKEPHRPRKTSTPLRRS